MWSCCPQWIVQGARGLERRLFALGRGGGQRQPCRGAVHGGPDTGNTSIHCGPKGETPDRNVACQPATVLKDMHSPVLDSLGRPGPQGESYPGVRRADIFL
eukprot:scaffold3884_cov392-Prasinococcus_capsulatus_cf.AAC.7